MSGVGLTVVSTLVVIGVLVFVHELGHFLAAKWAGIYVHRFSLGLGAPIRWLSFRRGETEYSVSWLPLGGYVKMASAAEEGAAGSLEGGSVAGVEVPPGRMFEAKPVWVRMVVILAGVVMNTIFAWLVFSGLVYFKGLPVLASTTVAAVDSKRLPPGAAELSGLALGDHFDTVDGEPVATWQSVIRAWTRPGDSVTVGLAGGRSVVVRGNADIRRQALAAIRPLVPPIIADVVAGRAGAAAGLIVGDTVVTFDARPVREWREMVAMIEARAGQRVTIEVGRAGGRRTISAEPRAEEVKDSTGIRTVGRLGIAGPLLADVRERVGLIPSLGEGGRRTGFVAGTIVGVVRGIFSGRVSAREVGGPISIGVAAGESVRRGLEDFLIFMAAISVNLAIVNLLPIPILDGGQFLFLLAEGVTRRPVTGRVREWLTVAGFVVIAMLMVLAFSNDIRRLLGV